MLGWLWAAFRCLLGSKKTTGSYEGVGSDAVCPSCTTSRAASLGTQQKEPAPGSGEQLVLKDGRGASSHVLPDMQEASVPGQGEEWEQAKASEEAPTPEPALPECASSKGLVVELMDVATPGPRAGPKQQSLAVPLSTPQLAADRHALKDITSSNAGRGAPSPSPAVSAVKAVDSCATPDPSDAETPMPPATQPFRRYMVDSGKVVGVDNTVTRYRETKPVTARETPFNVRVLREMEIEERLLNTEGEAEE